MSTEVRRYTECMPNQNFKMSTKKSYIKKINDLLENNFYADLYSAICGVANSYRGSGTIKKRLRQDIMDYYRNLGEL